MASGIISSTYKVSFEDHKKRMKQAKEELANRDVGKVADYFVKLSNISSVVALEMATDVIIKGYELNSNNDADTSPRVHHLVDAARKRAQTEVDEKILMAAFPVELKGKRSFNDDCDARKWQNEDYVKRYLGQKQDRNVTYVEILLYRVFCSCFCEMPARLKRLGWTVDEIDNACTSVFIDRINEVVGFQERCTPAVGKRRSWHHSEPFEFTKVHQFLRETCASTRLAHIIVNGHGSPSIVNESSSGNDDNSGNTLNQGGRLCVHIDEHVENTTIVSDITKCFSSIPADSPPYEVRIVFAQCHTDKNSLWSENPDVTVVCLAKKGQPFTFETYGKEHQTSTHYGLAEDADNMKKKRAQREHQN